MVECQLPKLDVAGSTPVSRSKKFKHLAPPVPTCTPFVLHLHHQRAFQLVDNCLPPLDR